MFAHHVLCVIYMKKRPPTWRHANVLSKKSTTCFDTYGHHQANIQKPVLNNTRVFTRRTACDVMTNKHVEFFNIVDKIKKLHVINILRYQTQIQNRTFETSSQAE